MPLRFLPPPAALGRLLALAGLLVGCRSQRMATWLPPTAHPATQAPAARHLAAARPASLGRIGAAAGGRPRCAPARFRARAARQQLIARQPLEARRSGRPAGFAPVVWVRRRAVFSTLAGQPLTSPTHENPSAMMNAVLLFWLGAALLAVGGVVLGLGLGGFSGLLAALVGLGVGGLVALAGAMGITSHGPAGPSRFNLVTLAGLGLPLAGIALGWRLGGLAGVGVALLVAGVGAIVTGIGLVVGLPG